MNYNLLEAFPNEEVLAEASTLTPEEKMEAWHDKTRICNIKAASEAKLNLYNNICLKRGFHDEALTIEKTASDRGIRLEDVGPLQWEYGLPHTKFPLESYVPINTHIDNRDFENFDKLALAAKATAFTKWFGPFMCTYAHTGHEATVTGLIIMLFCIITNNVEVLNKTLNFFVTNYGYNEAAVKARVKELVDNDDFFEYVSGLDDKLPTPTTESLSEDTKKIKDHKWTNKGSDGTHGVFTTKKAADAQRKAMFANGYNEGYRQDFWARLIRAIAEDMPKRHPELNDTHKYNYSYEHAIDDYCEIFNYTDNELEHKLGYRFATGKHFNGYNYITNNRPWTGLLDNLADIIKEHPAADESLHEDYYYVDLSDFDNTDSIATLSEEQKSFFSNSQVRDLDDNLIICYHGAPEYFNEFKDSAKIYGCKTNLFFFTTSYDFAECYAENAEDKLHKQKYNRYDIQSEDEYASGGAVLECVLNCTKVFDFRVAEHINIVADDDVMVDTSEKRRWSGKDWKNALRKGYDNPESDEFESWNLFEDFWIIDKSSDEKMHIIDWIKNQGFDCIVIREYGAEDAINFIIFDKNKAKFLDNKYPTASTKMDEDIEKHDKLNPKLFTEDNMLKDEVREKVEAIVTDFTKTLADDGIKIAVDDVILIGSNVSYNYTKDSDLDIHIVANTKNTNCPDDLYPKLYSAYRSLYNRSHDIDFYGIPVEIYVETEGTKRVTNGEYSVRNNKWNKEPSQEAIPEIDEAEIAELVQPYIDRFEEIKANPEIEAIDNLLEDIYAERQDGLTRSEYDPHAMAFKEFRNQGYLDELKELRNTTDSKELSLESLAEAQNKVHHDFISNWQDKNTSPDLYEYDKQVKQVCNYYAKHLRDVYAAGFVNEFAYSMYIGEEMIPVDFVFFFDKKTAKYPEGHLYVRINVNYNTIESRVPFSYLQLCRQGWVKTIQDVLDKEQKIEVESEYPLDEAVTRKYLTGREREEARIKITQAIHTQPVIQDNGRFQIYNIKENDLEMTMRRLRNLDFIDQHQLTYTTSGKYDFSRFNLKMPGMPSRYFNITGVILMPEDEDR